jgi:hypothetical protein
MDPTFDRERVFFMQDKNCEELAVGPPDRHEHSNFEIDDCCGFDLDYWEENISEDDRDDG